MPTGMETKRRVALALFVASVAGMLVLSLVPPAQLPSAGINDKVSHALTHALLALLWFTSRRQPRMVSGLAGLAVLGILVEGLQSLTGYRHAEGLDVAANLLGTATGSLIWHQWARR